MNFLRSLLGESDSPVRSYEDFWSWFVKNERTFLKVVKEDGDIEEAFFNKLGPKLDELREGYFFLAGMIDDDTAELVFTADGVIKNIVFVEELVASAPPIPGWVFTAHKAALDIENVNVSISGLDFNQNNLAFFPNQSRMHPDEIEITVVYDKLTDANKSVVTNGVYIFLDNFLGEIRFATEVDFLNVAEKGEKTEELIPVRKLNDYITWRQKEFIEKYEGIRRDTQNDHYAGLEAELENEMPLIAVVNTDLLQWDSKASHPWIVIIKVTFGTPENNNGLPDEDMHKLLDDLEEHIDIHLNDFEGYLNIGRQTAMGTREIYFACKDFRKPSKVLDETIRKYASQVPISFDIHKDKYWRSFDRFNRDDF